MGEDKVSGADPALVSDRAASVSALTGFDPGDGAQLYPREWFRVSRNGTTFERRIFIRETAKALVWLDRNKREHRVLKETAYERWYPTAEMAAQTISANVAARRARDADRRIRDAAPELLSALQRMHAAFNAKKPIPADEGTALEQMCVEVISKALGEDSHNG